MCRWINWHYLGRGCGMSCGRWAFWWQIRRWTKYGVFVTHSGGLRGLGKVMGLYYPKSMEGGDGNIHVPIICTAAILGSERRVLVDVLRHEYAHALEDNYEQFVHVKAFTKAFGAEYGDAVVFKEGTEENYVSTYAQSMTQEDFAETFMFYMKYKGKLPEKWAGNRAIRTKWSFIDDLRAKIYDQL